MSLLKDHKERLVENEAAWLRHRLGIVESIDCDIHFGFEDCAGLVELKLHNLSRVRDVVSRPPRIGQFPADEHGELAVNVGRKVRNDEQLARSQSLTTSMPVPGRLRSFTLSIISPSVCMGAIFDKMTSSERVFNRTTKSSSLM